MHLLKQQNIHNNIKIHSPDLQIFIKRPRPTRIYAVCF